MRSGASSSETELFEPASPDPAADGPFVDAFISYSWQDENDRAFVEWLRDALEARGKRAWVDRRDIEPAADWRQRIERAIGSARAVIFVVSPASITSSECARELDAAATAQKKLVPVVRREVDPAGLPEALTRPNWILCLADADRERCLGSVIDALDTDLGWRDEHTRLGVRAQEWREARGDRSLLLRGRALRRAEHWYQARLEHAERPTMEQEEFLAASRRGTTGRLRRALVVCVIGLVALAALSIIAVRERTEAIEARQLARSQTVAIQATDLLESNVPLGMLLSIEAYELAPTDAARAAVAAAASQPLVGVHTTSEPGEPGEPGEPVWSVALGEGGKIAAGTESEVLLWEEGVRTRPAARWETGGAAVWSLDFSPNGETLAAGTSDMEVVLWDLRSDEPTTLEDGGGSVRTVAFSPDGRTLATGNDIGRVVLWDVAAATWRHQWEVAEDGVFSLAYSPDGTTIATGARGGQVAIWDAETGDLRSVLRPSGSNVRAIAFSPDGAMLASGDDAGQTRLWDLETRSQIRTLEGAGGVRTIGFLRGGTIVVGDLSGQIRRWDAADGTPGTTWDGGGGAVQSVATGPDGDVVVSGDQDGRVMVWSPSSTSHDLTRDEGGSPVWDVVFTPDGEHLVTGDETGRVAYWSIELGTDPPSPISEIEHGPAIWSIALSPDGETIAAGGEDDRVLLWDPDSGASAVLDAHLDDTRGDRTADQRGIRDLTYNADGTRLIVAHRAGLVVIWDTETREPLRQVDANGAIRAVSISPDGHLAATGADNGRVTIWDTTSWSAVASMTAGDGDVWELAFSPDGSMLAAGDRSGQVVLWNFRTRQRIATLDGGGSALRGLAFDHRADGTATVAAGDLSGRVTVWDAGTWAQVASLDRSASVWGVDFSPDGSALATTDQAGNITVSTTRPWTAEFSSVRASLCAALGSLSISSDQWSQYLPDRPHRRTCP